LPSSSWPWSSSWASVGTCTAPRSRLRRSLAYPWALGRRRVPRRSYARRFRLRPAVAGLRRDAGAARGMSPVPAWLAMSYPVPAPLHAVRVRHGSRRQRRHAPCLAAPGVPLRCVVGRATAPARDRASAAVIPRATVIPLAAMLAQCDACSRTRGTHCASISARPVRLRARLNAGLGKVRRWAAPLVLARWPRAVLPPPAGPPSAGVRAERGNKRALAWKGRIR
jgi:hypothetical protein